MTFIAFNVETDYAEIATDTLTYEKSGRSIGHRSKIDLMPHLDAAMMVQGDGSLHAWWLANLPQTDDADDFDELDEITQELLPVVADELEDNRGRPLAYDSTVFHIGWSPARGRFVAYGYPSAFGFARQDFTGELFVYPGTITGEPPTPTSTQAWVDMAKQLRRERAMAPMGGPVGKVFVGGAVLLTRLERGAATTRRVHTFDDTGDEFAAMVDGTAHPTYQRSACLCGSGFAVAACPCWDKTIACLCGSEEPMEVCCLLPADELPTYPPVRAPSATAAKVGRNEPCPCGSGRKAKKCACDTVTV